MEAVPLQSLPADGNSHAAPASAGNMSDHHSTAAPNNEQSNYTAEDILDSPGPTNICKIQYNINSSFRRKASR